MAEEEESGNSQSCSEEQCEGETVEGSGGIDDEDFADQCEKGEVGEQN